MAVAVKNTPETTPGRPLDRLAIGSLAGTVYVLGSLGVVFYGLRELWAAYVGPWLAPALGSFVNAALLLLVMAAAVVGLVWLGRRLVGPNPPAGLRAGVFTGIVGLLLAAWAAQIVGLIVAALWPAAPPGVGLGITLGAFAVLVITLVRAFFQPKFQQRVIAFEEQGWFTAAPYKKNQGQRVRRGTILGVLILAGCGIYVLLAHKTLNTVGYYAEPGNLESWVNNWTLAVPFAGVRITLLPDVRFTVPLLLGAAALWFAYRLVNFPAFADFLIATEAEMNKVSWTSRRRLVQDTIVVLTTVLLMTVFLFVVDLLWGWILSSRMIGVLQAPAQQQQLQKNEQIPW
jgi:preprotein translocase SecE subunit